MDGVLNLYKPISMTSHDAVDHVRRAIGQKDVGHCGTLDPLAEGVLVVCIGRATRLVPYLQHLPKGYRARMRFGISTDTQDAAGRVTSRCPADHLSIEHVQEALRTFTGQIEQIPPMYSAIKHGGQKLYELARKGIEVERKARTVEIERIELRKFEPGEAPCAEIDVECSAGTYIRTLAADLGQKLQVGGHVESLLRLFVGHFHYEQSTLVDDLTSPADAEKSLICAADTLPHIRRWSPSPMVVQRMLNGNYHQMENRDWYPGEYILVMDKDNRVALIARWLSPLLRPVRVIGA